MTTISTEEMTTILKTAQQGLSLLRDEHSTISRTLEAITSGLNDDEISLPREKNAQVNENFEKLMTGIDETSLMMLVAQMMRSDDLRNQKTRDLQKLLNEENGWLREELSYTQKRLQESESAVARLEEELNQLRFLDSMKNVICDTNTASLADESSRIPIIDVLDLGFDPEEEMNNHNNEQSNSAPSRLQTLNALVIQYIREGRTEIAGPLCKQALEELMSTSGKEHPDVATMLNVLAMVYRDQQKYKEASGYLEQALAIREKCFGETDQLVASTLNNMAIVFGKRGKYREAEGYCRRALKIREMVFGENDPDVAKQLNNLALLCLHQGKYEEVEDCHRKALKILERLDVIDDMNTLKTQNQLASILLKQGKYEEAQGVYKTILTKIHKKSGGIEGKSLWEVAEERQRKMEKGEKMEVMETRQLEYLDNPDIITSVKNLAAVYRRQGKYEAADTLEDATMRGHQQSDDSNTTSNISMEVSRRSSNISSQNNLKSKLMHVFGFKF
ncbi:hypothetical protein GCK72_004031 [Caenorhabditis remanei]|uniref:Kinesin light chain n=1 Tax=Caenorhabditis remanei TaxID=31234 RepID=A0A6A5HA75_CAERE|nr:hypothetical protein GCK72_004031 [Caenorhabditis remanei]KAF1764085.1 hypothetical protein GCK72_004031 [Caenorhabditis remanei]